MPNIKSAKKRVKVIDTRTERNKAFKSALKTSVKTAVSEKSEESIKAALKKLDQSVSKGILHKNKAARKKQQLIVSVNNHKN
jgi:small subunit ribosomal protein S20